MTNEIIFVCGECGNREKAEEGEPAPMCCEERMRPLEPCRRDRAWAEHARNYEQDEPCDDGRGKI